ncbi:hypothetical protein ACQ4PT_061888 [Festuca glaucescens]
MVPLAARAKTTAARGPALPHEPRRAGGSRSAPMAHGERELQVRALDGRSAAVTLAAAAAASVVDLKAVLRSSFPPAQISHNFHLFLKDKHPLGPAEMVEHLKKGLGKGGQIVHVEEILCRGASYAELPCHLSEAMRDALESIGITRLYSHQALAQDQLRTLVEMKKAFRTDINVNIYNGDTPREDRLWIRDNAQLLITNPDMLHLSILSFHGILSLMKHIHIKEHLAAILHLYLED